ncbi:type II toxin-antitoxin system Phd/YefM family antitoxin [Gallibacterium trehalosifermentans]|uniref:Antitoxin n=1 Tax=Gallibacterium trehalosifermentans TaxID=516935 RepID=A0ABV6H0D2_9PAST
MTIITSREFNQHLGQAQKAAQVEPVIITNRGEPLYVLMSYVEYMNHLQQQPFSSIADVLSDPNSLGADVELDIPARRQAKRAIVDLEE